METENCHLRNLLNYSTILTAGIHLPWRLLSYGTDIYTTSKLLGHTSVKTTEIYAHIVDEKKRAAVDNIPKL